MSRLTPVLCAAVVLCVPADPATALTGRTQELAAPQLVESLRTAGGDPARLHAVVSEIRNNPFAVDRLMKSGDEALIRSFLKNDAVLRNAAIEGSRRSVAQADETVRLVEEAFRSGTPQAQREAVLTLLENSEAVNRLNRNAPDELKRVVGAHVTDLQTEAKSLMRERIAAQLGVSPDDVAFVNTTHPSAVPKVGQDWDLTVRVRREVVDRTTGKKVMAFDDVRPDEIAGVVRESFYEAATGKKPPVGGGDDARRAYRKAADEFSESKALEITWAQHREAIGGSQREGRALVVEGALDVRDAEQLGLVSDLKAQRPVREHARQVMDDAYEQIRKLGVPLDHPEASRILTQAMQDTHRYEVERARTYLKMFDKHIDPRVTHYGGEVPETIRKANQVLRELAEDGSNAAEVARRLGELGTSVDDVIGKATGLVEAAKKLRPPPGAEAGPLGAVGTFFRDQWEHVKDNRLVGEALDTARLLRNSRMVSGAFTAMGHTLGGLSTAGDYAKGLLEEMDRAIGEDTDIHGTYALVRAWDSGVRDPAYLVADLLGKGLEHGAIGFGKTLEAAVEVNRRFFEKAQEQGIIDAFGETYWQAFQSQAGGTWDLGTAAAGMVGTGLTYAGKGIAYTVMNGPEASLVVGEALGVQAVGEVLFREHETLIANDIELRDHLRATAASFERRAEALWSSLETLKQRVRTGDPAAPGFDGEVQQIAAGYRAGYADLASDYAAWWQRIDARYGGLHNPSIANTWREIREPLARVTSLPQDPLAFLDPAFIRTLVSTVEVHVTDGATGKPVKAGGYLQLNGPGVEKVCRGDGPVFRCEGVPPGELEMTVRAGDYAPVSRGIQVDPLQRRHYRQRVELAIEAPAFAWITVNVRDVETQEAIPGARIRFKSAVEPPRENVSSTGAVRINQVRPGQVEISASAKGYAANRSRLAIDTLKQTEYVLDLYLQPSAEQAAKPKARQATPREEPPPAAENRLTRREEKPDPAPDKKTTARKPEPAAERKAASDRDRAKTCWAKHEKTVNNALAANSDGDGGHVTLYASAACQSAHKRCEDKAYQSGAACRAKATSAGATKACADRVSKGWERCAYQEVKCSASALKQKCDK